MPHTLTTNAACSLMTPVFCRQSCCARNVKSSSHLQCLGGGTRHCCDGAVQLMVCSSGTQVVVYTNQLPTYADPILDRLDPSRYIAYRRAALRAAMFPFPPLNSAC